MTRPEPPPLPRRLLAELLGTGLSLTEVGAYRVAQAVGAVGGAVTLALYPDAGPHADDDDFVPHACTTNPL